MIDVEKKDVIEILKYVFDHYLTSELDDDHRDDVEKGYDEVMNMINGNEKESTVDTDKDTKMIDWKFYRKNEFEPKEDGIYLIAGRNATEIAIFADDYQGEGKKMFHVPEMSNISEDKITHYAEINYPTDKLFLLIFGDCSKYVLQKELVTTLASLGVEQALESIETGIEFIFIRMAVGDSASFDSVSHDNIYVQRISQQFF